MITSVHQGTMNNLLLGAGVFLKDFQFDEAMDADALRRLLLDALADDAHILGATRDGSQFTCKPKLRSLHANGVHQPYVGGVLCDGWQVQMTGTLIEVTPENMALLLGMGRIERHGSVTAVTAAASPCTEDHLSSLCWIGRQGSGYVLIELLGAMNMTGVTLSIRDQDGASAPFSFQAHALSPMDQDAAPFRMVWFGGERREAE